MRKWRENFLILPLYPPSLSISYIKICHILSQNVKYGIFVANVTKTEHTRYEEIILGRIRCEEALQVVPACRLCYMKTAPNCHITRPTCCTPQHKTSIKGPFHFRRNNHVLLLSQNINFSLSGHYNQGMVMLWLNISKEFSADILQ